MSAGRQFVTKLLHEWSGGNQESLDQLMPLVYEQLRKLASRCLRDEKPGHTLRATALVNEAYLRLVDADIEGKTGYTFSPSPPACCGGFWSTLPALIIGKNGAVAETR
jgi:hypothetical protein